MDNRFGLRHATDADDVALSQFNQQVIRETFVDGFAVPFDENDLESYFRKTVSPELFANKITDPQQEIWLVEDKTTNEFVAFANVGPCSIPHPDVSVREDGELYRLYVRRDRQGYELGQTLMNVALSWLEERFAGRPIWLDVWSGNLKAQKFYTYYNFKKVGEYYYTVGKYKSLQFFMRRESSS